MYRQDEPPGTEYQEVEPQAVTTERPGSELLLDTNHASNLWPKEVAQDRNFIAQIQARREVTRRLHNVLVGLQHPDVSLQEAAAGGILTEDQVADLYVSLQTLLAPGSEYQRILLYLPFEFLPQANWNPLSPRLKQAVQDFRASYLAAWEQLLWTHDVRANFVDGDVLEVDKRKKDLPRVVKAAHLIPKLVEAGFITVEDVLRRLNETDDEILRRSIEDTIPVLSDMGLMEHRTKETAQVEETKKVTLAEIDTQLADDFSHIDVEDFGDVTKRRDAWLKQNRKWKVVNMASKQIQAAIEGGAFETTDLHATSARAQQAFIEGVRRAIETATLVDQSSARALLDSQTSTLESLWKTADIQVHESLTKTFYHLYGLGLIDEEKLKGYGLTLPALAGPFSENLKWMQPEIEEVRKAAEAIERNPEITKLLFPVVLVYGSRLKGYGSTQSDIDVAVIVRPGVQPSEKTLVRKLLQEIFHHERINGEVAEFWTQAHGKQLQVIDSEDFDPKIAENSWTHILFGAAWEGKPEAIAELRAALLTTYFYNDGGIRHGREIRGLYLEELERDALQYRLMHKGYEKFYPPFGGIHTPHADLIDGDSTFWDSGYRQTATKLYASHVFLPKLERPE